jgi:hypothetical protein
MEQESSQIDYSNEADLEFLKDWANFDAESFFGLNEKSGTETSGGISGIEDLLPPLDDFSQQDLFNFENELLNIEVKPEIAEVIETLPQQVISTEDVEDTNRQKRKVETSPLFPRNIKKAKQEPIVEAKQETTTTTKPKSERYVRRLEINKKAAQASRERKRQLKAELEKHFEHLRQENKELQSNLHELETENRILKNEFAHLQSIVTNTSLLTRLLQAADPKFYPQNLNSQMDWNAWYQYQYRAQQIAAVILALVMQPVVSQETLSNVVSFNSSNTTPVA